jgi:hypothetical protein
MSVAERSAFFRDQAAEGRKKAAEARSEEMRRAWLIVARDWTKMAEREELKYLDAPESKLSPEDNPTAALEDAIRELAARSAR